MDATQQKAFLSQIEKIKYPVIILPDVSNKETICAALGLYNILKQKVTDIDIISYKKPDPSLSFLEGFSQIKSKIEHARNFVLSFNTQENSIENVYWEQLEENLNIYITPKKGTISPKDFSFAPGQFQYDFVIVPGAPELQHVGLCYEDNADLFFDLPIANIDYHLSNEQYGQINLADVKAAGVSEVAANIFLDSQKKMPPEAADCFYAGLLEATESFQSPRTTPQTLTTAARLIDSGSDHKKVVQNLYKTQSISTIKLWGQLMARIEYNPRINLAWITAKPQEFLNANLTTQKLRAIFDKIRNSYRKADTLMLLWQNKEGRTHGLIQNSNKELLKELLKGIEWGTAVIFENPDPLEIAEPKILQTLEEGYKKAS